MTEPSRILACVVGLSPQVVTEAVWALAIASDPQWVPNRIELLATAAGANTARAALCPPAGAIAALGAAYARPELAALAAGVEIDEIADHDAPVEDILDARSATVAGDAAFRFVRRLTAEPDTELHLSIAGGRKSLTAVLSVAMTLFARPQDRLSHIALAGRQVAAEAFFPAPSETAAASLAMHEIPFPRLRGLGADLPGDGGLTEHITRLQRRIEPCRVDIAPRRSGLLVNGVFVRAPASLVAWAAALAQDAAETGGGLPRVGLQRERVAAHYRRIPGARPVRWPDPLEPEQVEEWTSRLNKLVRTTVGQSHVASFVVRIGTRSHARYKLSPFVTCRLVV